MSDLEYDSSQDAGPDSWSSESGDDLGLSDVQGAVREAPFSVLGPMDIILRQQEAIAEVHQAVDTQISIGQVLPTVSVASARLMLQHFRWDAAKMLAEYTADPRRLRDKLGLPDAEAPAAAAEGGAMRVEDTGMCLICLEDEEELLGEECGHKFCLECWRDYLHGEVLVKHTVIICPGKDCSKVLDELTVISYLEDEDVKNRFRATLVQSFVDDNPLVRWCPGAHCTNAIVLHEVSESKNEAVSCSCGVTFCFRCGAETDHRPNSCRMFNEWNKKQGGGDTSLNDQLIATISRQCPKCNTSIQKNGGCNHMRCTNCAYHFCWQCMAKFGSGPKGGPDGYNTHRCNRPYEEDGETSQKKEELQRFHWHSDRYGNHARSLAIEQKLLSGAPAVVAALSSQYGLSEEACKFYLMALQQLVANRHLLMQSYVFGYFRPQYAAGVNRDIFENLQLDLELHTEKLSHLLEDTSPAAIQGPNHQAILHLTQVARNVYNGLMDSANEWTSMGVIDSPPSSPPLSARSSKSASDISARIGAANIARRSGKAPSFFKKLFRRNSEDQGGPRSGGGGNNNNNNSRDDFIL